MRCNALLSAVRHVSYNEAKSSSASSASSASSTCENGFSRYLQRLLGRKNDLFRTKYFCSQGADGADDADGFSAISETDFSDITRLPRWSGRLKSMSIPVERKLPAMRRSALLSMFGALGHRRERRAVSLASLPKRSRSSLEVPLNPARATSRRAS